MDRLMGQDAVVAELIKHGFASDGLVDSIKGFSDLLYNIYGERRDDESRKWLRFNWVSFDCSASKYFKPVAVDICLQYFTECYNGEDLDLNEGYYLDNFDVTEEKSLIDNLTVKSNVVPTSIENVG